MLKSLPWSVFFPLLLSAFVAPSPIISYSIAWLGSFYVFFITWIIDGKYFSEELPIAERFMKPIFLLQGIFAGFMCLTSIFYFIDNLDNAIHLQEIAKCQRLSLLAHIALVFGIYLLNTKNEVNTSYAPSSYLKLTILSYILGFIFNIIPGLFQFSIYFYSLAGIAGTYLLVKGIQSGNFNLKILGWLFFSINFISATLTGFKEHIIVNLIILFVLLFPLYKRLIIILSLPTLYVLIYILPTYASVIRSEAWTGNISAEEARAQALDYILNEDDEQIANTNWEFLTNRLSEINMFTKFVNHVPEQRDYYYFEILDNALSSLVPRVLWPDKPITEQLAMQRVYDAEVVSEQSVVSAKTRPVVDGYLSFGAVGVFISIFLYGLFVQWAFNKSEELFGGYELGGVLVFNGIFQDLWRGNNFEFILNNMVYGAVSMYLLYWIVNTFNILKPTSDLQTK